MTCDALLSTFDSLGELQEELMPTGRSSTALKVMAHTTGQATRGLLELEDSCTGNQSKLRRPRWTG